MPKIYCKICTSLFYAKPNHIKKGWGKYCSKVCQYLGQRTGKYLKCTTCSLDTWKTPRAIKNSQSKNNFCSKSCQTIWRNKRYSGNRHSGWTNGIRAYRKRMLDSEIEQVCSKCGIRDIRVLLVHHIDRNRANNVLKNLMWLCRNCHYLIHDGKTI